MQLLNKFGLLILLMDLKIIWIAIKIFGLVGDSMRQFRNEMTVKQPPKTVKEVIRSLIPPQGIKQGKNIKGSELSDGEEIEEEEDEDKDEE